MQLDPRVYDLSDRYANFMVSPRESAVGPRRCRVCRTFVDGDWERCWGCNRIWHELPGGFDLDVVVPITYSPALGQMHTALRGYKDAWGGDTSRMNQFTVQLAAVLHRFLAHHERCVAAAAGVDAFDLVTSVPSGTVQRDDQRERLRFMLSKVSSITKSRYERILTPTDSQVPKRDYDPKRFQTCRPLAGERVLLIDDTWTTGSSAQSAACALKEAGAATVAMVVIGRHMDPDWTVGPVRTADLLDRQPVWDWETCAVDGRR